ncbi:MAG: PIG-L family deacetylase [Caulobacteraceae bacterium]|nr:PIG-L family deacetylase [Caulobacteraceae bacterium]
MSRSILVLAPHTDDAELGCGGAIAKAVEAGDRVAVVAFSDAEQSLPAGSAPDRLHGEMRASLRVLGVSDDAIFIEKFPVRNFDRHRQAILDKMIEFRTRFAPDLVFAPAGQDVHQDHDAIHREALRAFRRSSIWCYELPWNQLSAETTGFIVLDERHVEAKFRALQCYESQVELDRPYFRKELIYGMATMRGVQAFSRYAEAFQALRTLA